MRKQTLYISCPKKGSPKKHIQVCTLCRRHKGCKPYQRYLQPELPFTGYRSVRVFYSPSEFFDADRSPEAR